MASPHRKGYRSTAPRFREDARANDVAVSWPGVARRGNESGSLGVRLRGPRKRCASGALALSLRWRRAPFDCGGDGDGDGDGVSILDPIVAPTKAGKRNIMVYAYHIMIELFSFYYDNRGGAVARRGWGEMESK